MSLAKEQEAYLPKDALEFKEKFVGDKCLKITISDGRVIYGHIACIDSQLNTIIMDGLEQINPEYISPVSSKLKNYYKQSGFMQQYIDIPEELIQTSTNGQAEKQAFIDQLDAEFMTDKFYVGQVVIPGKHIVKVEVQKQVQNKQNQS